MALQFDAYNEAGYAATSTPSVSITVPAGTSIIIVGFTSYNGRTATATFDGNAMTLIRQNTAGGTGTSAGLFYYLNPGTGSKTVVVTLNANDQGVVFAAAIIGTATTSPVDTDNFNSTSSNTTLSTTLTTTQATCLLISVTFGARATLAADGAETQGAATLDQGGIYNYMSYKYVTASGANSMTANQSTNGFITMSAVAIKEASAGGAASPISNTLLLGV